MSVGFNDEEIESNMQRRIFDLSEKDRTALMTIKAEIRREARQRCLDELEAFSKGEEIESGVGTDVERVYLLLLQRHENRQGFTPA